MSRPAEPAAGPQAASAAKLAWLLSSLERLRTFAPARAIPRKVQLDAETFRDAHYAANWPVLLSGAVADWPAVRRWTPAYLKARVGAQPVQVQVDRDSGPDFERNRADHTATLAFDAFIDRVTQRDAGNDVYLTADNHAANAGALSVLDDDLGFLGAYLTRDSDQPQGRMWIGAKGSFTPLHHDLTNNLLLQLVGRKVVLMAAPGETPRLSNDHHVYSRVHDLTAPDVLARFPRLGGIRIHRILIGPGDGLFIPLGWWHQVSGLDFSVSITHTNFRWPNDFQAGHPLAAE